MLFAVMQPENSTKELIADLTFAARRSVTLITKANTIRTADAAYGQPLVV